MAPVDRSTYSSFPEGFPLGSLNILFSGESLLRTACPTGVTLGKSPRTPKEIS